MSVRIRFQLAGAKRNAVYKIVVADSRFKRDGRFLEKLGTYFPLIEDPLKNLLVVSPERIQYWVKNGAQISDTAKKVLHPILFPNAAPLIKDPLEKKKTTYISRKK